MFESIDRPVDPEARRRGAASFVLTSIFYGSVAGGLAAFLTWQVEPAPEPVVELPVVFFEPPQEPEPPGPPELPVVQQSAGSSQAPAEPEQPVEPTALPPEVPPEVADPQPDAGIADDDNQDDGTGSSGTGTGSDGEGCSDPQCVSGGGGGGPPKVIAYPLQLEARKRVEPRYPEAARALGLGQQRCVTVLFVDEEGIPYDVEISGCPASFHSATREALMTWRFYPPKMGKNRVKAQMSIAVTYRLDD